MRILCTNDDGFRSPGIVALCDRLRACGHEAFIAAPRKNMSGMSAAIGALRLDARIDVERDETAGGAKSYGISGPPALAVLAAHLETFGARPELVMSGVNAGLNTGGSVVHSGTVGAALTAAQLGTTAMAVSVDGDESWRFEEAAVVASSWLDWLAGAPPGTVVNVNVPDRPLDEMQGTTWAPLDPLGAVQVAARPNGSDLQLELLARPLCDAPPGSDTALVLDGWITATMLEGVSAAEHPDRPAPRRPRVTEPASVIAKPRRSPGKRASRTPPDRVQVPLLDRS